MSVPSNLVPTRILQLPEDPSPSDTGWMMYVNNGVTYKVQVNAVLNVSGVPTTRAIIAGTGLAGGGTLASNVTLSVAPGGIGATELDDTGVTPGVYGDSANYPVITVDANGRITAATELSFPSPSGFVPTSREVIAGVGLSGGGALTTNVTLDANLSNADPLPVGTQDSGTSDDISRADHVHPAIDLADTTQTDGVLDPTRGGTGTALNAPAAGGIVYSDGANLQVAGAGIVGQVLYSGGTGAPTWATIAGTGTVTSVDVSGGSTGLSFSGGPITTAGTITMAGTLDVDNGGTGATTAAGARSNLQAAILGTNNDITSMTALSGGIVTPDFITFDVTPETVPTAPGSLYWDAADGNQTLSLVMAGGAATMQVGEEIYYRIKADSTITEGQVIMFTGTVGASGALKGAPATGLTAETASYVMGVATQNIETNGWGYITSFGLVRGIDTSGSTVGETWADGDILYYNPSVAGGLTNVIPVAPNAKVQVAAVVNAAASQGSLFIRPTFGGKLGQYEGDVNVSSATSGNTLIYDAVQGRWENADLTAGTGVSVTNGAGSITIANTGVTSFSGDSTGLTPATATTGAVTLGGTLNVSYGGTGANTLTGYVKGAGTVALTASSTIPNTDITGLGTMSTQDANNVNITGGVLSGISSVTLTADPTLALQAATKQYVDNLVAIGTTYHEPVYVESPDSAGSLNATYNNGTAGVGATLTNAGTQAALTIDGVLMTVGKRVLIYNQTNGYENGVYEVTTVGDGSTNWVLTRTTDADSYGPGPDAIDQGSTFFVQAGATGAGETYTCTTIGTITFGTTNITFAQIAKTPVYSAGTGLTLTGTTFSLTSPVAVSLGGTGQSSFTDGQLLIGNSTGNTLAKATLTAGTGISITNGSGTITVATNIDGGTF